MLIKPAPGLVIRDPATKLLVPDEGLEVSETDLHWNRLLRDSDVVRADQPASPPPFAQARAVVDRGA